MTRIEDIGGVACTLYHPANVVNHALDRTIVRLKPEFGSINKSVCLCRPDKVAVMSHLLQTTRISMRCALQAQDIGLHYHEREATETGPIHAS
jgi:hypothetical protein